MLDEVIDLDLRNAFSHNQYVLDRVGMTFARDDRFVSYEALTETFSRVKLSTRSWQTEPNEGRPFFSPRGRMCFEERTAPR